mmetsp:Transcript_35295/g.109965  ORF Transcript_35295/g.109965 Transcript_35295/m.109965 type:complete len:202 (-) Transcript_35295:767-1372(-)
MHELEGPRHRTTGPCKWASETTPAGAAAVASGTGDPAPQGVDRVRPQDAPDVPHEEPERDRSKVELPRHGRVDVPADGAVDEAVAHHHQEGAERRQQRHPQEYHKDPSHGQEAVAYGVARLHPVAEPPTHDAPDHVEGAHGRNEGAGRQGEPVQQRHGVPVVDVQEDAGAERGQGEHVDREGQGVVPHLRKPRAERPRIGH